MHINFNKYIKRFDTEEEFVEFNYSEEYEEPNLSYVNESDNLHINEKPLKFTAEEANSTIKLTRVGTSSSLPNAVLQYSTNGVTWNNYTLNNVITLTNIGDYVMFKGNNERLGYDSNNYHKFVMTGKISASGDISSLTCNNPLVSSCYQSMFDGCTSLTTAPELPESLLSISISKLTKEEYEALLKENEDIKQEIAYIKNTTIQDMYLKDLAELKKKIEKDFPEDDNPNKTKFEGTFKQDTEKIKLAKLKDKEKTAKAKAKIQAEKEKTKVTKEKEKKKKEKEKLAKQKEKEKLLKEKEKAAKEKEKIRKQKEKEKKLKEKEKLAKQKEKLRKQKEKLKKK